LAHWMRSRAQATAAHCSAISLASTRRRAFSSVVIRRHAFWMTTAARMRLVDDRRREHRNVRAPSTKSRSNMRGAKVDPATIDADSY
jgi:hypothetical protein